MAGAKRYQDLICWQLADELETLVLAETETGPASRDFRFRDQIRDSSSSATRNMAEGFGRFLPADHANFLRIAAKAATRLILYLESQIPQQQRGKRRRGKKSRTPKHL